MADKRLDQENVLTDFDYALIVKGADVAKISKADLAKVVGGLVQEKKRVLVKQNVVTDLGLKLPGIFSITAQDDEYDANMVFVAVNASGAVKWQTESWWLPGSSTLSASSSKTLCIKHYLQAYIHVKRIG